MLKMMKKDLVLYKKNTIKSSKLFKESKKFHVNGVHHNIRFFEPYPFVTKSSKGKFLIDVILFTEIGPEESVMITWVNSFRSVVFLINQSFQRITKKLLLKELNTN